MIEQYEHHGQVVSVDSELKGKHREHCLCFKCARFVADERERSCPMANALYALDVAFGTVTPVYECPEFIPEPIAG